MGGGERKSGPDRKGREMRGEGVNCKREREEKQENEERQRFISQVLMPESGFCKKKSSFVLSY